MNLVLRLTSMILLASSSIFAKNASELTILNLENNSYQESDILKIKTQIKEQDPDIICIFNNLIQVIEDGCENTFCNDFPFVFKNTNNTCVILSKYELSYIQCHDFGPNNTVIEMASNNIPEIIINAHLPNYSQNQLNTLKSYFIATNPYLNFHMIGDLAENTYLAQNLGYLIMPCTKKGLDLSVEGHKNGDKEVKVDAHVSSDDGSKKLELEAKYSQNNKGESDASAKASLKIEY